jgi:isopenicillin-N epimerase
MPRPPTFGASLRERWMLDPAVTYLNHGTVGAPPRAVLAHQRAIQDEIERQPAQFLLRELADAHAEGLGRTPRMREAAAAVAEFVGLTADDELVFVDNITAGANAVLRSFPFQPADELLVTSLGYGGVVNAATFTARDRGCALRMLEMPRPGAAPEQFLATVATGLSPATRVLIIDHLSAETALVLPLIEIAEECHRRGVLVFADGAHVPGNIPLDIASLGVDWYCANLHKWAWAPRSCGILWAAPEQRAHLHPAVISWGLDNGIAAEFDLVGTRDPSPYLTAPFAIEHMREYGLDAIYAYNHDLAWWAGNMLAEAWGRTFTTPESMIGAMVNVHLPERFESTDANAGRVRGALEQAGFELPVFAGPHGLETRVSLQIYCEHDDVKRLADAVTNLGV